MDFGSSTLLLLWRRYIRSHVMPIILKRGRKSSFRIAFASLEMSIWHSIFEAKVKFVEGKVQFAG
jgi:hypothetical protein